MLDCQIYGLASWGHHLTSLILHIANTLLVLLLLYDTSHALWRSLFVAAFFGLHPLHIQSVAWVAERKDVLSTFFCILALWSYVGFTSAKRCNSKSALYYGSALFLFVLGLMCKPMLVTVPFLMLLLDFWPLGRWAHESPWRLVAEKAPFFILSVASSAITLYVQKSAGAMAAAVTPTSRLANALVAYSMYLGKLVWPHGLSVFYPLHPLSGFSILVAAALLCGLTFVALVFGRRFGYLPTGWLWFLGTLVPVIGLIQVGAQAMADRYTYIPSIGIFVIAVWGTGDLVRRYGLNLRFASGITVVAILACALLTRHELTYWRDGETLFRRAIEITGSNCIALYNLADELAAKKRYGDALLLFEQATKMDPGVAEAHLGMGMVLSQMKRWDDAATQLAEAVRLRPANPVAHFALGLALAGKQDWQGAITQYRKALSMRSNFPDAQASLAAALDMAGHLDEALGAYERLVQTSPSSAAAAASGQGHVLFELGRLEEAKTKYRLGVKLQPGNADAHKALGVLLAQTGHSAEAEHEYEEAVRLSPRSADIHYLLGGALAEQGDLDQAIDQFNAALEIEPNLADAHNDLGVALDAKGRLNEAITHLMEAVKLDPTNPETHNNLGGSLARARRFDEAIGEFEETLRLKPGHTGAQSNLVTVLALKNAEKR
jgi:tetratricopeptide (TPR) repeat protein